MSDREQAAALLIQERTTARLDADHCERAYRQKCNELQDSLDMLTDSRRETEQATKQLAGCYRLSGADPDGNEDDKLAPYAVEEVKRLRKEYEELGEETEQLRQERDAARLAAERRWNQARDSLGWTVCPDCREVQARADRLEQENKGGEEAYRVQGEELLRHVRLAEAAEQSRDALRAALNRYGRHEIDCRGCLYPGLRPCTCGFGDVLALALADSRAPKEKP